MKKLVYTDHLGVYQSIELSSEVLTLGRNVDQTIQILDKVVSKAHAVIEKTSEGDYLLRDNESRNGTYLNSERLTVPTALSHGDEIRIGATVLTFVHQVFDAHPHPQSPQSIRNSITNSNSIAYDEDVATSSIFRSQTQQTLNTTFHPADAIEDHGVLRRDYERLRVAHELSRMICLETDRDNILTKIVDAVIDTVGADRVLVMLRDDIAEQTDQTNKQSIHNTVPSFKKDHKNHDYTSERLVLVLLRTSEEPDSFHTVHVSRTILNKVLLEKQAIRSEDALADARFNQSQSIVFDRIRSTMTVPLLRDDEVLGVIHLDSKSGLGIFSEKDLAILIGLARQISLLLEHILLLKQIEEEVVARESLYRLLPPRVVEQVLAGNLNLERQSAKHLVTVMFVDIRGFTQMSESLEPEELVIQLNAYFEVMVEVVFRHGGTLDKLIGDEIMAVWGAPIRCQQGALQATTCAFEMLQALHLHNQGRNAQGLENIQVGIGINTGPVIAGYMGSSKSLDYTVTGDTVNVAARLCEKAKSGQVLVGPKTWEEISHLVRGERMKDNEIRGKTETVDIYHVMAFADDE